MVARYVEPIASDATYIADVATKTANDATIVTKGVDVDHNQFNGYKDGRVEALQAKITTMQSQITYLQGFITYLVQYAQALQVLTP